MMSVVAQLVAFRRCKKERTTAYTCCRQTKNWVG